MSTLDHNQVLVMLLAVATLLASARFLGECARRYGLPAVLGEIIAGVVLGPTVLGVAWPEANAFLFPAQGVNTVVLHGLTTFAVVLFLLVAGLEVDLSTMVRLRRSAAVIGASSIIVPFSLGAGLGWLVPEFMGGEPGANPLLFALFLGVAMAICALPVIAKTLMDINLYRTDLGMIVIATAIIHDLVGWIVFAVVLGMMSPAPNGSASVATTIVLALGFAGLMLTLGRWGFNRCLPWVQAHTTWPGGILAFAMTVALLAAAATEAIGIHAMFGAFLAGVAFGDSPHLRERTRRTIEQFVGSVFAPIFFASIGLRVDFVQHFDIILVVIVVIVACVTQTFGGALGALWSGFPRRHAWAIGFALNARGAMGIVLALLALQYGVIGERLFVALVVMALLTSIIAGPAIQRILRRHRPIRFVDVLHSRAFVAHLSAATPAEAIRELAETIVPSLRGEERCTGEEIARVVLERETIMPTALDHGIAIPHGRLAELTHPYVAVGIAREGIDFNARDGQPSRLVFLVLTPESAAEAQLEILADIARSFVDRTLARAAIDCKSFTEFVALLNTGAPPDAGTPARSVPHTTRSAR